MKNTFLALLLAVMIALYITSADAQVYVNGYTNSNGTYVQPHVRTSPDSSLYNNYSTKGNYNPYTGKAGTVNPNSYSNSSFYSKNSSYGGYSSGRRSW